jgi:FkbM family methyltransferase
MAKLKSLRDGLMRNAPALYRLSRRLARPFLPAEERAAFAAARRLFAPLVPPGGLCFDVGANHGARTDVLLSLGARVVAVEPQPHCLEMLKARFGADRRFRLVGKALGAAAGKAQLHVGGSDLISTLDGTWRHEAERIPELASLGWHGTLEVEVTTLDALIAEHGRPDFVKIDVEGFELEVLRGLSQPLPLVSVEHTVWRPEATLAVLDRLESLGRYEYNYSELETMALSFPDRWLSSAAIREHLRQPREQHGYGDVYARALG